MSNERPNRLLVDLAPGQSLRLEGAGDAHVELVHKTGRVARIKIVAPASVRIIKNPPSGEQSHCDARAEHG